MTNHNKPISLRLHSWKPFKFLPSSSPPPPNNPDQPSTTSTEFLAPPNSPPPSKTHNKSKSLKPLLKKPRYEVLDLSKLSLIESPELVEFESRKIAINFRRPWKRCRRASRSVSGRSSTTAAAAAASNSDFPIWVATDSSGELFVNGDSANWASDDSKNNSMREVKMKEVVASENGTGFSHSGVSNGVTEVKNEVGGVEAGYSSEPGYRGDVEYGYGDEIDEEDDGRVLFWGDTSDGDADMEVEGGEDAGAVAFSEQKIHHRCRRKKHDSRMVIS